MSVSNEHPVGDLVPASTRLRSVGRRLPPRLRRGLAVFAGGILGTLVRTLVEDVRFPASWPWATFTVNVTGALALGYLLARLLRSARPVGLAIPFVAIGLLGAYTTFGTFAVETLRLGENGRSGLAVVYAGLSVVAGLVAGWLGVRWGRRRP